MKAKICGITRIEDAMLAHAHGAWAIGFNFYPRSPRYIDLGEAEAMAQLLPASIKKVGIFVNATLAEMQQGLQFLDYIQIYQHQSSDEVDKSRCILALQATMKDRLPPSSVLKQYGYLLLDAPKQDEGLWGGTGRQACLRLAGKLSQDYPLILAGGLNCENVAGIIEKVHPYAVDVASGIEIAPGIKRPDDIKTFLMRCQYAR